MSRTMAVFYSTTDDTEHALHYGDYGNRTLYENTFNPNLAQGGGTGSWINHPYDPPDPPELPPPIDPERAIARALSALYYPDNSRYFFFASYNNQLHIVRYPPKADYFISHRVYDDPFPTYQPNSIADISAVLVEGLQMYIVVLMTNGDLHWVFGYPNTVGSWEVTALLFNHVPGSKAITAFYDNSGHTLHILAASDHDITHVQADYVDGSLRVTLQDSFFHFEEQIIDISGFITPDDSTTHLAVATVSNGVYRVYDISFYYSFVLNPPPQPPQLVLVTNPMLLGTVDDVYIQAIGAYVKPDTGRHVVMRGNPRNDPDNDPGPSNEPDDLFLYLSWYYPGWQGFAYTLWPGQPPDRPEQDNG
jgi:hypothetical protein